ARIRAGQAPFPMTPLSRARYSAAVPFWLASLAISGLGIGAGAVGGAWGVGLGALAGAVALVVVALLHNGILRPLDGLRAGLEALDEGRLGERIETPAGSHRALRAPYSQLEVMRIHLRAMFADVLVSAHDIEAKSRKLDDAVRSLGKTAQDQSDRLSQVAAAMEQMSVSVNEISENTAQGVEAARRTEGLAQDGMTVMAAGIESSGRVVTIVETSRDEITQVNEAVARIGEVTNIIREIAEQTNLLALNAAIEAARAGEHGRGFAVVADEVRKLSERTSVSTQHISSAVGDIVRRAHSAVATMGSASQDVVASTERIRASSESLQQIWAASGDAVRAADEITGTLQQQSTASQEVAKAMEQISGSVEATTHDVSTIGEATTALRGTAEEMRLLIRHLEGALK
ncbi:MAG: methyl-accepting chemotaxis protein, partial [Burkholderiales bacterium]|nr:methyl-accepting chemotaxis protein [Burkholderiales bacterium]